jgi:cellulose synthase/poly-beta-1,6-N-acetylglucosamine synthase-like glycosyltransferase
MKYDKFWVAGLFVVIALWLFVLIATLNFVFVTPQNMLMDTDYDLKFVTLVLMSFTFLYLFMGAFIYLVYLFGIGRVKRQHFALKFKKSDSNLRNGIFISPTSDDLCSIIIPARDEESVIRRAVLRCLQQTHQNVEILVIAHNSSDRTYEEAQVDDPRVRPFDLRTEVAGKSVALNYGIDQSRGKYIVVLDADTVLEDDFIESALPAFDSGKYVGVQGRVYPINRDYNFLTRLMAMEDDLWQEPILTVRSIMGKRCPLLGTGFILRKDVLVKVGKFSNALVDDHELTCKLLMKKYRILYLPYCKAYAEEPPSLEVMLRQRARWGRGFLNCLHKRMAEPTDILGNLLWLMPISSFCGSIMLFLISYASIHNILFEYIPFTFTYLPLNVWFIVAGMMLLLDSLVFLRVHGLRKGLKYIAFLVPFIAFSQYGAVVLFKALFVKTWGTTKTVHGFMAKNVKLPAPAIQRARK